MNDDFDYLGTAKSPAEDLDASEFLDFLDKPKAPKDDTEAMEYMPFEDLSNTRKQMEEQRRDLRRQQYLERASSMGLNNQQTPDLNKLFNEEEQLIQQNEEEKEQDYGMSM